MSQPSPREPSARDPSESGDPVSAPRPVARTAPDLEVRALGALAIVAVIAIFWVVRPVAIGILLGTLNAFVMASFYERVRAQGRRSALAAAAAVTVSTAAVAVAVGLLAYLLVARGVALATSLIAALQPGTEARATLEGLLHRLDTTGGRDLAARARDAAGGIAERAAATAASIAAATTSMLLGLFFMLITTHYVLRRWSAVSKELEDVLPLHPRHTRALLSEFRTVGRAALLGTVVTGLAQGVLAGIGYWIGGLPEPAFFGAVTAIASLVPAIGTVLVWLPAGIAMIVAGHVVGGIVILAWGTLLVVGFSDYVLRPRLVGGAAAMPALLTFAALFGGVETFGLSGLIVGPLVMATAVAVLRIHAREAAGRRHQ